tara:strand:+ start:3588 stop:4172 length:585 start_codon:yes stop_codon:yes gene_type:complete
MKLTKQQLKNLIKEECENNPQITELFGFGKKDRQDWWEDEKDPELKPQPGEDEEVLAIIPHWKTIMDGESWPGLPCKERQAAQWLAKGKGFYGAYQMDKAAAGTLPFSRKNCNKVIRMAKLAALKRVRADKLGYDQRQREKQKAAADARSRAGDAAAKAAKEKRRAMHSPEHGGTKGLEEAIMKEVLRVLSDGQ